MTLGGFAPPNGSASLALGLAVLLVSCIPLWELALWMAASSPPWGWRAKRSWMVIGVSVLMPAGFTSGATASDQEGREVLIEVVNHAQVLQYRTTSVAIQPQLVGKHSRTAGSNDPLAAIIRNLGEARSNRRRVAGELQVARLMHAKWAIASQNGLYALVGFQDPQQLQSMRSAALVRSADGKVLVKITSKGVIEDVRWLPGSQTVLLLESNEHLKWSLFGLLSALAGHPIPIHSFYLRVLDAETAREHWFEIVADIENATACLCSGEDATSGMRR
jgi:hypothetical protein